MSGTLRELVTPRNLRIVAVIAVLALMIETFLSYRLREPPTRSVSGVYFSQSCGTLIIRKDEVEYAGNTARMKVIFDKFGLVGELDRPLGPFFVQTVDGKKEPVWLSFDAKTATTLDYARRECVFARRM